MYVCVCGEGGLLIFGGVDQNCDQDEQDGSKVVRWKEELWDISGVEVDFCASEKMLSLARIVPYFYDAGAIILLAWTYGVGKRLFIV